jgi:hypothetical protein
MLNEILQLAQDGINLAEPAAPKGDIIDTSGIIGWLIRSVGAILLAVLGIIFIARARTGQVSQVLTSSMIALVGVAFLGGAAIFVALGDDIVNLVFN